MSYVFFVRNLCRYPPVAPIVEVGDRGVGDVKGGCRTNWGGQERLKKPCLDSSKNAVAKACGGLSKGIAI